MAAARDKLQLTEDEKFETQYFSYNEHCMKGENHQRLPTENTEAEIGEKSYSTAD